jgi:hypothetical protein
VRFALAAILVLLLAGCVTPTAPGPVQPILGPDILERQLTPKNLTASEVSIAANPRGPANLVASANFQGGLAVYWTKNAGETWTASLLPTRRVGTATADSPARFLSLGDPAVAFGPDGTAYIAGLAIIPTSAVFVASSSDGGETWSRVQVVHESDLAASFNDKEWIGASPKGTLIVAWQKEPAMDSLRAVDAALGVDADLGDIVFARSTDRGATWSLPMRVSRGLHNNGTQVAFTADGRGHMLWVNYETSTLDYVASEDDGATWSAPRAVAKIQYSGSLPRYSRIHTLPGLAASSAGQTLAATWHDARNGDLDIYAVASADGGRTWGEPVRVNDDEERNGNHQMFPWIAIDPDGRVHVTFYDPRDDPAKPRFLFYHAAADDATLRFGTSKAVSTTPFTAFTGGVREARSLGDYTGLAASSAGLFPVWADGRFNQSAVFSARVPLDS